jgi:hypothetical protein
MENEERRMKNAECRMRGDLRFLILIGQTGGITAEHARKEMKWGRGALTLMCLANVQVVSEFRASCQRVYDHICVCGDMSMKRRSFLRWLGFVAAFPWMVKGIKAKGSVPGAVMPGGASKVRKMHIPDGTYFMDGTGRIRVRVEGKWVEKERMGAGPFPGIGASFRSRARV